MGFFDQCDQAFIDALDGQYDKAEVRRKYVDLPEGNYQAYIDQFGLRESRLNAGEFGLSIVMVVTEGPYKGSKVSKYLPVDMDSMDRLKADLQTLEFRYDGVTSLDEEERLREMLDVIVDVRVTKKKSPKNGKLYSNVWINRRVGVFDHPPEAAGDSVYGGYGSGKLPWGN